MPPRMRRNHPPAEADRADFDYDRDGVCRRARRCIIVPFSGGEGAVIPGTPYPFRSGILRFSRIQGIREESEKTSLLCVRLSPSEGEKTLGANWLTGIVMFQVLSLIGLCGIWIFCRGSCWGFAGEHETARLRLCLSASCPLAAGRRPLPAAVSVNDPVE